VISWLAAEPDYRTVRRAANARGTLVALSTVVFRRGVSTPIGAAVSNFIDPGDLIGANGCESERRPNRNELLPVSRTSSLGVMMESEVEYGTKAKWA
jgi:hypothetical protein